MHVMQKHQEPQTIDTNGGKRITASPAMPKAKGRYRAGSKVRRQPHTREPQGEEQLENKACYFSE